MRTIKLYITCSDELTLDKNVIGNLVRQLNHVNNPKGISIELWDCEDYDLSDAVQSDMFVALFHKEADKLFFDGIEKANEAYSTKKSPKVFIYFKDLITEEESRILMEQSNPKGKITLQDALAKGHVPLEDFIRDLINGNHQ